MTGTILKEIQKLSHAEKFKLMEELSKLLNEKKENTKTLPCLI